MRRLLRILLNAATVLSILLCVVAVAAWVRSYRVRDIVWGWSKPRQLLGIVTYRGGFTAAVATPIGWESSIPPGVTWEQSAPARYGDTLSLKGTFFNHFGFALDYFQDNVIATRQLACPYWFIMLLTAILPGARLAAWRRRARRLRMRPGLCRHCGYDCRATPDRCPECGTPAAAG
jgi:hypothetical protein